MAVKTPKKVKKATFIVKGKECVIAEPDFKQLAFGLSALNEASVGDLVNAGKAIYDVCVLDCDQEIKDNPTMLMSICMQIANEYVLPYEVEIKKN